jgi:hypothetical protein
MRVKVALSFQISKKEITLLVALVVLLVKLILHK